MVERKGRLRKLKLLGNRFGTTVARAFHTYSPTTLLIGVIIGTVGGIFVTSSTGLAVQGDRAPQLLSPQPDDAQPTDAQPNDTQPDDAQPVSPSDDPLIPPTCPEALESLIPILLDDLPSYANRVTQRSFNDNTRSTDIPGTILIAGRPEYEALSLGPGEYVPDPSVGDPYQIFFTTLERQYVNNESVSLQNSHWLFLTQTESGWRFSLMFTRIGIARSDQPPNPPYDSSEGAIAQAVRLWLRDCNAGALERMRD
jgi:hypothetical protein